MTESLRSKEKIDEMVEFIASSREEEEQFWWLGEPFPNSPSPRVSDTLRGFLDEGFWLPFEDEIASCCASLMKKAKDGKLEETFEFMRHCMSKEHIRTLLNELTDEQLDNQYQFMLTSIMNSLEKSF